MEIKGMFKSVIYYNESNSYLVARFVIETTYSTKEKRSLIITGNLPILNPDESYSLIGEFKHHDKYGRQFYVKSFSKITPASTEGIVKYLSSSLFPGIGKNSATKIVDYFGEKTLDILSKDPEVIFKITEIKKSKLTLIVDVLKANKKINELHQFFLTNQISMRYYMKLTNYYGEDNLLNIIKEKNYQIIEEVEGINFKVADQVINKLVNNLDPKIRVKAALVYAINQLSFKSGNTTLEPELIFDNCKMWIEQYLRNNNLSNNVMEMFVFLIKELDEEYKIRFINQKIASAHFFDSANFVANYLQKLVKYQVKNQQWELTNTQSDIMMDKVQLKAAKSALEGSLTIITGGPGTGKTSIIKYIMNNLVRKYDEKEIFLLAPTGKASKILRTKTHFYSSTIHKALMWDAHTNRFEYNETNPLAHKVLIIDEFSMVDIWLLEKTFRALPELEKLIIVGDDGQLESVLPGSVLRDLLNNDKIKRINLKRVYRQGKGSGILELSKLINQSHLIAEDSLKNSGVNFFELNNHATLNMVAKLYVTNVNKYGIANVQILAPVYNGVCGIDAINRKVQNLINPLDDQKTQAIIGIHNYRSGDKIMHLKNRKDTNLFNGDIGYIQEIDVETKEVVLEFDKKIVKYKYNDFLTHVTLAYAISVHKAQGSENHCIIMPILRDYYRMLNKKIVYTAITRASKELFVIGELSAFNTAIKNRHYQNRDTILGMLL